jgi:hypothetical protein
MRDCYTSPATGAGHGVPGSRCFGNGCGFAHVDFRHAHFTPRHRPFRPDHQLLQTRVCFSVHQTSTYPHGSTNTRQISRPNVASPKKRLLLPATSQAHIFLGPPETEFQTTCTAFCMFRWIQMSSEQASMQNFIECIRRACRWLQMMLW